MIRQSSQNVLYRRAGRLCALLSEGIPCAEHQRGMGPFAKTMGFKVTPGALSARLRGPVAANRMFLRRAALVHPIPNADVLTLGSFARAGIAKQEKTIRDSPADFDKWRGTFGGRWLNTTPMTIEESFLDLMEHSDLGLGVAFDHKDVLVGGTTNQSKAIVAWLAGLFAGGEACLLTGHRSIVLCDPGAAADLAKAGLGADAVPLGYEREALRSDTSPVTLAA